MNTAVVRARLADALVPGGIAVLTGAGMSAESGIPTFRDAMTGLWSRFDPAQLASVDGFRAEPARVWDWYAARRDGVRTAQPNAGHRALASFADRHPGVLRLVTQNVDNLHQRAGNADTIRLHGDILEDRWLDPCRTHCGRTPDQAVPGRPPRCAQSATLSAPASSGSARCCRRTRWTAPSAPRVLAA